MPCPLGRWDTSASGAGYPASGICLGLETDVTSWAGVGRRRPPKAIGTYGFLGVLRHPSRLFRSPKASEGAADIEAVRRGEARSVSCFLRGTFDPFPRKLKQGELELSSEAASWTPFWSISRHPLALELAAEHVTTRPADSREPHVKKGEKVFGVMPTPAFVVVNCTTSMGVLELVVPSADGPLVAFCFEARSR